MFEGFKFNSAVAAVLARLNSRRLISSAEMKTMSDIAMRGLNHQYGKQIIAQRGATNASAAAAAVFCRLAVVAEHSASAPIRHQAWDRAARMAFELAGASEFETDRLLTEMKGLERDAGWGGPSREA